MTTPYSVTIEDDETYSEFEGSVVDGVAISYGEINTASNVGVAGVGVFKQKTALDLEFKKINAGSSKVTVTDDTANNEIDIDVALALDDLSDVSAAAPSTGQAIVWDGSQWVAGTSGASSPLTTKGDLYTFDSTNARFALGSNGHWLKVNTATATGLEWSALAASDIASGTFDAARIPNLDASKITTGIMNIAQIPTIPAANVSAGTFPVGAFTFTTSVTSPRLIATDTSVATEGADVAVNGTFDVDANWTKGTGWSIGAGVATKTAGTQSDLSQSVGQAAGQVVRVRFTYTRTAGTLSVLLGGATYPVTYSAAGGTIDIYIRATNTSALIFRGDATFAGTIDNVQVNLITARTQAIQVPVFGTNNFGVTESQALNVTGTHNTFYGADAGKALTSGGGNTIMGSGAGEKITSASHNTIYGYRAAFALITGTNNMLLGRQAGAALVDGSNNVAVGYFAGLNIVSAGSCVFIGANAGSNETLSSRLYIHPTNSSTPLIFGIFSGAGAGLTIHSQNTAGVPLIVKGIASQSNDLEQWQDSTGAVLAKVTATGNAQFVAVEIDGDLNHDGSGVGFYGTAPAAKPTITGSRGGNAALESLLTALAAQGLITDSTSA
jgi:hypothetical protein